jgi:hypothetical protein
MTLAEKSKSGGSEAYGRPVEGYQDYDFATCLACIRQRDLDKNRDSIIFLRSRAIGNSIASLSLIKIFCK